MKINSKTLIKKYSGLESSEVKQILISLIPLNAKINLILQLPVYMRDCLLHAQQSDHLLSQPNTLGLCHPGLVEARWWWMPFPFLWSPLHCCSMPGRIKNRLKRQETDIERMFGCWLLSYQPFSHLMKQLSALQLIKYPPVTGQSCKAARPWESCIRF